MASNSTAGHTRAPVVAISGYYGFDNLGDEAVLYSLLGALGEVWPDVRPVVLSHSPERTAAIYGVQAVNRWRLKEVYHALAGADLLISGGGSLLQDVTGLKSLIYYLGVIWLARRLNKPVVFYAQGIGPVKSKAGRLLMRLVANDVQLITVRDEKSARDLAEMGVTRPEVKVTADPVLGLDPAGVDREPGRLILEQVGLVTADPQTARHELSMPVVGVSVREWPGFDEKQQQALARVCDDLCRGGYRVLFIPLHFPEDLPPSRKVAALMQEKPALVDWGLTVPEAVSLFARLDLLIGMRLHALILAAVMGVPPVGISYDPKIDRFLDQLGLIPAGRASDLDYRSLRQAVNGMLIDPGATRNNLVRAVEALRKRARSTARLVSACLPGEGTGI